MSVSWPLTPLGDVLIERKEIPRPLDLERGHVRIISKIGFATGQIEFRDDCQTKTNMILIRPGDLVLSGINAAKGAIAVYDDEKKSSAAATIHYGAYTVRDRRADPKFLWWLLRSDAFRDLLNDHLPGGIKTELKAKRLLSVPIRLPSLEAQRRILAKIERLAAKIDEARALRHHAGTEAGVLLRSGAEAWFQQLSLQVGCARLNDVCLSITDGDHNTPPFVEEGVPFIFVGNVSSGRLHFENAKRVSESYVSALQPPRVAQPGDILYSAVGATLGIPAIVDTRAGPDLAESNGYLQLLVVVIQAGCWSEEASWGWHDRTRWICVSAWCARSGQGSRGGRPRRSSRSASASWSS